MHKKDFFWTFFVATGNPMAYLMYKDMDLKLGKQELALVVPEED